MAKISVKSRAFSDRWWEFIVMFPRIQGIRPRKFDDILELKYHKTAASAAFFVLLWAKIGWQKWPKIGRLLTSLAKGKWRLRIWYLWHYEWPGTTEINFTSTCTNDNFRMTFWILLAQSKAEWLEDLYSWFWIKILLFRPCWTNLLYGFVLYAQKLISVYIILISEL